MKVDSRDGSFHLVEANIIEALEACARDGSHPVIGHEEVLLPPHKDMFTLGKIPVREIGPFGLFGEGAPGGKPRPVMHIGFLGGAPFFVPSLERVFGSDDLALKKGGQSWMVFCEA